MTRSVFDWPRGQFRRLQQAPGPVRAASTGPGASSGAVS